MKNLLTKAILPILVSLVQGADARPIDSNHIEIEVDATQTIGFLEPFWASQIVHPTEFLLTDWGQNFINTLESSGAAQQYVRIYNQPEKALRVDEDGSFYYDWSHFDEMAEIILASGNKMKVAFFGMPYELAKDPDAVRVRPFGARVCFSPPRDYREWEELVTDFSNHVLNKWGIDEVKTWHFRCWNEPDLGSFWRDADLEEYLKLYDHFAKAVKAVHPDIKIGGPALSATKTYRQPENFRFFLDHVTNGTNKATGETGSPIDFLSVHTYGGTGARGGPGREFPEIDYLMEQQMRFADMRDEYPKLRDLPIYVDEWGVSTGGTKGVESEPMADVRNSQYAASFLATWVERHVRLRQENDRNISGFVYCSSGYESIATHDFMGYRTLHTKNGFHKPILNAYKLLSKLSSEIVPTAIRTGNSDTVSAFASRNEDRITILVANHQYGKINNDGDSNTISIGVKTHWNPNASLTLKHWRIDETHSNAYSEFKRLGSPRNPNPIEIDSIRNRMHLEPLHPEKDMKNSPMNMIRFELPCNSVSLVEIALK